MATNGGGGVGGGGPSGPRHPSGGMSRAATAISRARQAIAASEAQPRQAERYPSVEHHSRIAQHERPPEQLSPPVSPPQTTSPAQSSATADETPAPTPPPHDTVQVPGLPPGLSLHPDFCREGDIVVLSATEERKVGFLVSSTALARMSGLFADAIRRIRPQRRLPVVTLAESQADMVLLLRALIHGDVGLPRPGRPSLQVPEYLTLLGLYHKCEVRKHLRDMLVHTITQCAYELADSLQRAATAQNDIYGYLRLAHWCVSPRMWETALRYAGVWAGYVHPMSMGEDEVARMGESAYDILLALDSLKTTSGEASLMALRVTYNGEGRAVLSRIKHPDVTFTV